MQRHSITVRLPRHILVCFLGLFAMQAANADNWPQWRGAMLDSVSDESNLNVDWKSPDSAIAWRTAMPGPAGASPIVWDDRIFVCSADGRKLVLICLDADDGNEQWRRELAGQNFDVRDSANAASPSPSTDGKHVWVMPGTGMLQCFTVKGEPVWNVDLQHEYGKFNIQFGMSSTPILHDGVLYVMLVHGDMRDSREGSQGHVVALDASRGKEIWHQLRQTDGIAENKHSYASPIIADFGGKPMLVVHAADYVTGHSLQDGSEQWREGGFNPKGSSYNPFLRFVASPVFHSDWLVVPSAKNGPVMGWRLSNRVDEPKDATEPKWQLNRGTPDVASPVIYDGHVYLARENGLLACLDMTNGDVLNRERLFADRHRSTPVAADGKLFVNGRDGKVVALKADSSFESLGSIDLQSETTASPAIANGMLYVRTFEELVAIRLQ